MKIKICCGNGLTKYWKKTSIKNVSIKSSSVLFKIEIQKLYFYTICRDPNVKRSLCKSCQGLLVPSLTARVQIKEVKTGKKKSKRKQKIQRWTCFVCHSFRDFLLQKDKLLWVEKSQNNKMSE